MNKELREAVAREICASEGYGPDDDLNDATAPDAEAIWRWTEYLDHADAAISIIRPAVLEEAAKVADAVGGSIGEQVATGIRALGKKP